jgi:hypothetical protein
MRAPTGMECQGERGPPHRHGTTRGTADSLEAARTVVAWANGFIAMELAGAFRLAAMWTGRGSYGIDHVATAIARRPNRA